MGTEQEKLEALERAGKGILRNRIDICISDLNELKEEVHCALTLDNLETVVREMIRWVEQERKLLKPLP